MVQKRIVSHKGLLLNCILDKRKVLISHILVFKVQRNRPIPSSLQRRIQEFQLSCTEFIYWQERIQNQQLIVEDILAFTLLEDFKEIQDSMLSAVV